MFRKLTPAAALLMSALVGCSDRAGQSAPPAEAQSGLTAAVTNRKHAVFHDRALVITTLESPISVMVAGVASPDTLISSDPDLVSVNADGTLIAHRYGSGTVRSAPNPYSVLSVDVRQIQSLQLSPSELNLRPGEVVQLRLLADGQPLEAESAQWTSDNIAIARADRDIIHATPFPGRTTIRARVGNSVAVASVAVGALKFALRGPKTLGRQQFGRFELVPTSLAHVEWTTTSPRVLRPMGAGIVEALAVGKSQLCASMADGRQCAVVEVTK